MNTPSKLRWLLLAGLIATFATPAHAALMWRVSVKIILDAGGRRPTATNMFNYSTPERIRKEFADYNRLLENMGWGFKIDLTEVVELGGLSQWFSVDARSGDNRNELEKQAKLHPNQYLYRPNALNVYVNNSSSGISGGHLPLIGDVIFAGAAGYWTLMLHEIGHGLGLCHTHGCGCNDNCMNVSDEIADTIKDSDGWAARDDVARGNFGTSYGNLASGSRQQVDFIWENIMSYHGDDVSNLLDRFTHDQWERMVDVSNLEKFNIVSGRSVFVDRAGQGISPCDLESQVAALAESLPGPVSWYANELALHPPGPELFFRRTCQNFSIDPPFPPRPPGYPDSWPWSVGAIFPSSPPPGYPSDWTWPPINPAPVQLCIGGYKTVKSAIDCGTSNGDRLQIKAGNYNEVLRITKPITLATDRGTVAIGRP